MLIVAKGRYLKLGHIWFENISYISELKGKFDKVIIHGNPKMIGEKWCTSDKQLSLMNDLTMRSEELYQGLTKTVRNEINRSKREGIEVYYYQGNSIATNTNLIEEFANVYHNMYVEKGMGEHSLNIDELIAYAKKDSLLISVARFEGANIVFHSYVYEGVNSRLLHSCSEFRVNGNDMRNIIGRANKFLHWNDFNYLKKMGVINYDWGGISSVEVPNGIDKFKMAFGGKVVEYYNINIVYSLRSKIISSVKNALK